METLPVKISKKNAITYTIELDADKLEREAAALGMFGDDFLASIDRAEADIKAGRVHKAKSLKELL